MASAPAAAQADRGFAVELEIAFRRDGIFPLYLLTALLRDSHAMHGIGRHPADASRSILFPRRLAARRSRPNPQPQQAKKIHDAKVNRRFGRPNDMIWNEACLAGDIDND